MHAIFRALFAIAVALVARSVAFATLSFLVMCIVSFGMGGFFGVSHVYPSLAALDFALCELYLVACPPRALGFSFIYVIWL